MKKPFVLKQINQAAIDLNSKRAATVENVKTFLLLKTKTPEECRHYICSRHGLNFEPLFKECGIEK